MRKAFRGGENVFSVFLRDKRTESGFTQVSLAKELGISTQYYRDIEVGNRAPIDRCEDLEKLASALNLSQQERDRLFDLAGIVRGEIPVDIVDYLMENPAWFGIIRGAYRISTTSNSVVQANSEKGTDGTSVLRLFK